MASLKPPHVGVVYDKTTLKPLRVIVQGDGEDGNKLFDGTHSVGNNEVMTTIPKSEIKGMELMDIALFITPKLDPQQ